jgi:hypothetical protein
MDPSATVNTPIGTRSIDEHTPVKSTLGRTIAILSGLCIASVAAGIGYARLHGRIETIDAKLEAHESDQSVHLESMYHIAHGRPVGNFDFTQITGRIEAKLDKVESKQNTVVCRPRAGGALVCKPEDNQ